MCELALRIIEQYHDPVSYARCHYLLYGMLGHWQAPLFDLLPQILENYRLCRAVGETQTAAFALLQYLIHGTYLGVPLAELAEQAEAFGKQTASMNQEYALAYLHMMSQFIHNLMGHNEEPHRLKGEIVDGDTLRAHLGRMQDKRGLFLIHSWQAILGYQFGHYDLALHDSLQAQRYADTFLATMAVSVLSFYDSLIRLAIVPAASGKERFFHHRAIRKNRKLLRRWAKISPANYAHKYELVQAEWHRYRHETGHAHACYQRAIALAKEHGFQWDLALGYELAGRFYHEQEQAELAHTFLRQAHQAYHAWGAAAKVRDLETRYPDITWHDASGNDTTTGHASGITWQSQSTSSYALDWHSVIKAAQTLSGEINLETLLTQLMRMVLENAGAEYGYLLLPKGQAWAIEAEGHVERSETTVLQSVPLEYTERVSAAIIHYVARTQEDVVLHDATNQGRFTQDAYIVKHRPTSVLCAPLVNQGQVTGILYLENNVTTGAFTPDRLEVLHLLASQAAISIENARLYDQLAQYNKTLEVKVAERTQALSQALDDLKAAQHDLIQSEKMAALGKLVANVAHEINTPIGAIRATADNMLTALSESLQRLPNLLMHLSPEQQHDMLALIERAWHEKQHLTSREERRLRRRLQEELEAQECTNADDLADLFVDMGIYRDVEQYAPFLHSQQGRDILQAAYAFSIPHHHCQNILLSVTRTSKIVQALTTYTALDTSGRKVPARITEGIDAVLALYDNQFSREITLIRHYADVPDILCYPDDLHQVWTHLIDNAIQAMQGEGTLEVAVNTCQMSDTSQMAYILVRMTDSGPGIPAEIKDRIFEPFFTTKEPGQGSGLGLDICRKIIDNHQGKIDVESQPGKTTFSVWLPV